jgi:osmotically-inducible protein OsmY
MPLIVVLGLGSASTVWAEDPSTTQGAAEHPADNTGRNVRDRDETLTSGDQSEAAGDREMTQKVRQAVMDDDDLSMTAKNIKIITVDGAVTLRGPVKSEQERSEILAKAEQIAGSGRVHNFLEVVSAEDE